MDAPTSEGRPVSGPGPAVMPEARDEPAEPDRKSGRAGIHQGADGGSAAADGAVRRHGLGLPRSRRFTSLIISRTEYCTERTVRRAGRGRISQKSNRIPGTVRAS